MLMAKSMHMHKQHKLSRLGPAMIELVQNIYYLLLSTSFDYPLNKVKPTLRWILNFPLRKCPVLHWKVGQGTEDTKYFGQEQGKWIINKEKGLK